MSGFFPLPLVLTAHPRCLKCATLVREDTPVGLGAALFQPAMLKRQWLSAPRQADFLRGLHMGDSHRSPLSPHSQRHRHYGDRKQPPTDR